MTSLELPPELWIRIYSILATLSDSYKELTTYLLICKIAHSSLYSRLFETLRPLISPKYNFREWIENHRQTLTYAAKRVEFQWEADSDLIVSTLETCPYLERVAFWMDHAYFEDLKIARALDLVHHLRFLQVNVVQLSFLFKHRTDSSASFLQIDTLCLHVWNNGVPRDAIQALKSIDFLLLKSLIRLGLNTEQNADEVVPVLLTLSLPHSIRTIVIYENRNDWTTIPSSIDDHRIVYFKQTLFDDAAILAASISIKERQKYLNKEYPFDDWGEITLSKGQSIWLWADEALDEGKIIFSRPI
ncbi:hypothetical protein DL96DRAFT_1823895 [Flagelloscypha sp. PMI_526]|nr:hypothetical protein DL96DRAFT_1823895 [Flagelloscypha sp. PMI_526]